MRSKRPLWRDGKNLGFEECRQVAEGVCQSDASHGVAEGATQQQLLPSALTPPGGTHWARLRWGVVRTLHDAPGASAAAAADARRSVLEAMR